MQPHLERIRVKLFKRQRKIDNMKNFVLAIFFSFLLLNVVLVKADNVFISMDLEKNATYVTPISSNEFLFSYTYKASDITNLELQITLPTDTVVVDRNGLLISRPFDISTDGRRIYITWKDNLAAGEEFSAFIEYEGKSSGFSSAFIILPIIAIGAIGAFAGYRLKIFRKEKFIEKSVSDDENRIIDQIKKKGEILQEDLRDSLGWSKTKISKVVRNLEIKNVIMKIPYKKTNKLKIK
jgi:uncharacterized membrane protein